jgi:L-fucose isomerase-like protein
MVDKFGIQLEKRSFKALGAFAKTLSDSAADKVIAEWDINLGDISPKQLRSAIKVYMAISEALDADPTIRAVGINCLNESFYSDTTPCLAWSMLYQERRLIWGCEADTLSMITKYVLHKSLGMPIMMTNLYPFLMGQAALKHERIPNFPPVKEAPDDHVLVAHCGYLGVVPTEFSTEWALRKKVLAIVDDNATAIDARMPEGPMTLAKLQPTMESMVVMEGSLEKYVQYEDSDFLNGGLLRIADGHKLVNNVSSHHYLLMTGHQLNDIRMLGQIFDLGIDII